VLSAIAATNRPNPTRTATRVFNDMPYHSAPPGIIPGKNQNVRTPRLAIWLTAEDLF
jgi:hypothetical protein